MSYVYLAAPYTHANPAVRELRYQMTNAFAARLMTAGYAVFSPISQSHDLARYLAPELLLDHAFWMRMDLPLLRSARMLLVLKLAGWEESRGVDAEIAFAREHHIPMTFQTFDAHLEDTQWHALLAPRAVGVSSET